MSEKKKSLQYLSGMHAAIPVILGFVPVGIAYAIMARQAGFSVLQTCGMSLAVFAGASQMMAVGMYIQGASIIAMILATFILNLRHLIMSVCVVNRMRKDTTKIKLLAAFGVTDESFAIFTTEKMEKCSAWFFLGLITVTYTSWNVGTLIGAVASDFLPEIVTASLGIALYAMFIVLVIETAGPQGIEQDCRTDKQFFAIDRFHDAGVIRPAVELNLSCFHIVVFILMVHFFRVH